MIFKPKMTNYAEMITKRLQLAAKLVKAAKNWLVSQIFVRNAQENFLKLCMRPMDKMKEVFYNKANKSGQG